MDIFISNLRGRLNMMEEKYISIDNINIIFDKRKYKNFIRKIYKKYLINENSYEVKLNVSIPVWLMDGTRFSLIYACYDRKYNNATVNYYMSFRKRMIGDIACNKYVKSIQEKISG